MVWEGIQMLSLVIQRLDSQRSSEQELINHVPVIVSSLKKWPSYYPGDDECDRFPASCTQKYFNTISNR